MNLGSFWCALTARAALLGLVALALAGCLQAETTVTVNRDGSGTIVDRLLLSNETIALMSELMPEGETLELLDEAQLREDAGKFGEAVRFVSAEELADEFGKGFEARYAFDDVTALSIVPDVGDKIPGEEVAPEEAPADPVTFAMAVGDPAELTIRWPVAKAPSEEPEPPVGEPGEMPEPDAESLAMMQEMLRDLRLAMHVEVVGEILETNATHRSGARVTLLELGFAELLASESGLAAMMRQEPETLADLKRLMQDIPGMKLEIEPEVTVRFR